MVLTRTLLLVMTMIMTMDYGHDITITTVLVVPKYRQAIVSEITLTNVIPNLILTIAIMATDMQGRNLSPQFV